MKKLSALIVFSLFLFSFAQTNAQIKLVLNGGAQIPVGDFKDGADIGYGGSVDAEFKLPMVGTTFFASAGYNRWKITNTDFSYYFIPLMGGIKYFISTPGNIATPYISGALGITVVNSNVPLSSSESKFTWSPSVGVRISNFDINASFKSFSSNGTTFSWFGINVGVVLGR